MKRQSILTLAGMVFMSLGLSSALVTELSAETVPITTYLLPSSHSVNRLDMTLCATAFSQTVCDSDTTVMTGYVMADLPIDFDPVTHDVISINAIEFTGGVISLSDTSFTLDFGFLVGKINAGTTAISATLQTPSPPGLVSGGNFNTIDHVLILNGGSMYFSGTGLIGGLFDPFSIQFYDDPLHTITDDIGSITASLKNIDGLDATYDVHLTLPVNFDAVLYENDILLSFGGGTGTLDATGQFTRIIPEPATILLLALGAVMLSKKC